MGKSIILAEGWRFQNMGRGVYIAVYQGETIGEVKTVMGRLKAIYRPSSEPASRLDEGLQKLSTFLEREGK